MVRGNVVMTSYWVREIPSSLRYEKRSWRRRRREKGERGEERKKSRREGERILQRLLECYMHTSNCIQTHFTRFQHKQ